MDDFEETAAEAFEMPAEREEREMENFIAYLLICKNIE
jgi:hypothetical protein